MIRDDTPGDFIPLEDSFGIDEPLESENIDFNGNPKISSVLKINNLENFETEVKARAIDKFINEKARFKDTEFGFKTGLDRLVERLGINLSEEINKGNELKILDKLFLEVAINNKLSSETFLSKMKEDMKQAKIISLKKQLKDLMK